MRFLIKNFGGSLAITLVALVLVGIFKSPVAILTTLVLIAIELAFSFDNAIVNAQILKRLSLFWQKMFLTVGMVIAIVGMRLVFPILIVVVSAGLGIGKVTNLALHHPHEYAHYLSQAHPSIAAFGGGFLLTLSLYFLFNKDRAVRWLDGVEKVLARFGRVPLIQPILAAFIIYLVSWLPFNHHGSVTLDDGLIGVGLYMVIEGLVKLIDRLEAKNLGGKKSLSGWGAFGLFMYLQLLDASFSFDGVLGAFAITNDIILIVVGLGVGALWVRSLTVKIVHHNTLGEYIYLEHGAHYAILALSLALLVSIMYDVPDVITGCMGLVIIGASLYSSHLNRLASRSAQSDPENR